MKLSKNIHLIQTDKSSRLFLNQINKKLLLEDVLNPGLKRVLPSGIYQNICITNLEEIKKGDWKLDTFHNQISKVTNINSISKYDKKIILTTDIELINNGVQAIDDEFLQWFVKNPMCSKVEVERLLQIGNLTQLGEIFDITESWKFKGRTLYYCGDSKTKGIWKLEEELTVDKFNNTYKIIIPKEELKQELERGITITNVGKQETIEEVAKKQWGNVHRTGVLGFIDDTKWQAERSISKEAYEDSLNMQRCSNAGYKSKINELKKEIKRMYSEEEVKSIIIKLIKDCYFMQEPNQDVAKWFEKYKKK
jgi:hypothetical protein